MSGNPEVNGTVFGKIRFPFASVFHLSFASLAALALRLGRFFRIIQVTGKGINVKCRQGILAF